MARFKLYPVALVAAGQLILAWLSPGTALRVAGVPGGAGQSPVTLVLSNVDVLSALVLREQTAIPTVILLAMVTVADPIVVQAVLLEET